MTRITRWTIVETWPPGERNQYRYYEQRATGKTFETREEAKEYMKGLRATHLRGDLYIKSEEDIKAALHRRRLRGSNRSDETRGSNRGSRR